MSNGITIPNQKRIFGPYAHRLYSGDLEYTKSEIYSFVNQLTELVGNDRIIYGLDFQSSSYTNTDFTISLNPGKLIHDNTLIDLSLCEMDITYTNASSFDPAGRFIVFTNFKNYINHDQNYFRIGMMYVNSGGIPFETFNPETNRVILMSIQMTKDVSSNINGLAIYQSGSVIINGTSYNMRPTVHDEDELIPIYVDGGNLPD